MNDWKAVIEVDEIWEGDLVTRQVEGIAVLFVNIDGDVHAFLDKCPHAGTPLNQGLLEGRVLTCPSHLWQFDVVDGGIGVNPKNCRLTSYPVKIQDGKVLVQIRGHKQNKPECRSALDDALGSWSGCFGRGEACPPSRLRPSQNG